jgi:glycosyltransferase involved in cell wall biosynthesis
VEAYFGEDCFQLFHSDSPADLARALFELYSDPQRGERLVERAAAVSLPYAWSEQREMYLAFIDALIQGRHPEVGSMRSSVSSEYLPSLGN